MFPKIDKWLARFFTAKLLAFRFVSCFFVRVKDCQMEAIDNALQPLVDALGFPVDQV